MSPPASACCRSMNPSRTVNTRPPTRSRASTIVTRAPMAARSRAAARPASPAPATSTETELRSANGERPLNVVVDLPFEDFERQRAGPQDGRMKVFFGEARAEGLPRCFSQLDDLQLANHVGTGLSGVDNVSFDFARFDAVVDGLLTGPALGMKPRVDHQSSCAKERGIELAEKSFGIAVVPARLDGKLLRIQSPALAERGDSAKRAKTPEEGERLVLAIERDLEMMSRHRLVIDERPQTELRHPLGPERNAEHTRPRAVGGRS